MKQFQLNNKTDFMIYLHELIGRTDKCIVKQKKYLDKAKSYIESKLNENPLKKPNEIIIPYEEYGEFVDLFSNVTTYALNLIGDNQTISISYIKFREMMDKRNKKGTLDFVPRDLDTEVTEYLTEANKMRNWYNHVPESLLLSEIRFISEGKLNGHSINPINITYYKYCKLEVLEDLYINETKAYENYRLVHQNMKKDYSSLTGESTYIHRDYIDKPHELSHLKTVALSAEIQGLKGNND